MPIDDATYISDLQPDWPQGDDPETDGDDHIRMMKKVIKNTFPNIDGAVIGTPAQLNNLTNHLVYAPSDSSAGGVPENMECLNSAGDGYMPVLVGSFSSQIAAEKANAMAISYGFLMGEFIDIIYDVDSVYMNYTGIFPAWLENRGHTWELLGAGVLYNAGTITDRVSAAQMVLTTGVGQAGSFRVTEGMIQQFDKSFELAADDVQPHTHGVNTNGSMNQGSVTIVDANPKDISGGYNTTAQTTPDGGYKPTGKANGTIGLSNDYMLPPGTVLTVWRRTA